MKKFFNLIVLFTIVLFAGAAIAATNPWTAGVFPTETTTKTQFGLFDTIDIFNGINFEGAVYDDYQLSLDVDEPLADIEVKIPSFGSGSIPVVVLQGYTQFQHTGATTTVDVTGAGLTLPAGWFTEGKTFKIKAGGTVTGTNGVVSVKLFLEDGAVCTLTTGTAAAGDWTAEFIVIATGAATQRIIGTLIAGAGADPISDYATDNTNTATAGTIPLQLQVGLAHAGDAITCEYWTIEHWNLADPVAE